MVVVVEVVTSELSAVESLFDLALATSSRGNFAAAYYTRSRGTRRLLSIRGLGTWRSCNEFMFRYKKRLRRMICDQIERPGSNEATGIKSSGLVCHLFTRRLIDGHLYFESCSLLL